MIISFPYGIEYALQYLYKPRIPNSWKKQRYQQSRTVNNYISKSIVAGVRIFSKIVLKYFSA